MTVQIPFAITALDPKTKKPQVLTPLHKEIIKEAREQVFTETVQFVPSLPGPGVLTFGPDPQGGICTLSPENIGVQPHAVKFLVHAFSMFTAAERSTFLNNDKHLYFDIESHSVEDRWKMPPREFFRLGQYSWGLNGDIVLTTDYDELVESVRAAELVIGHNIHAFDLSVLFGPDSTEALEMALDNRVLDTQVLAALTYPAPSVYVDRSGTSRSAEKPEGALRWLSLDNLAYQLGTSGKEGDLKKLAEKYGGYGMIPTDDPEYREYAYGDIVALKEVTSELIAVRELDAYDWREQINVAIDAQNSRNGWRVDVQKAQARVDTLAERREVIMVDLQTRYGLPTVGKMPWRTTEGKTAILKALGDYGITPATRPEWPRTKKGNISLGGDALIELTQGTEAEPLGLALSELMGQRSLAQLALDSVQPDGKVHPEITAIQRSGRKSTTKPGLTVWTSRGEGAIEKSYFIPNADDEVLVEFDFSQADARIVAALSGDEAFKERFAPGVDAHELTGRVVFGDERYDTKPAETRQTAKALGHAWGYRAGAQKLSLTSGQPLDIAQMFVAKMGQAYPSVLDWQNTVTEEGQEHGCVVNDWGRVMMVERKRAYTQAPAMYGQSGTRELMVDALIRMAYTDIRIVTWLVAQVHDALVFSVPKVLVEYAVPTIKQLMETTWSPSDGSGQEIHFPVGNGPLADNWQQAGH